MAAKRLTAEKEHEKQEHEGAVAFCSNGAICVRGDHEGLVTASHLVTGGVMARRDTHEGKVTALCFSADGERFCSASSDGSGALLEAPNTKSLFHIP